MIELKNDKLCFSFPNVSAELRKLEKAYFQETLTRMLEEDRDVALDQILQTHYGFSNATKGEREHLRILTRELPKEQIAAALKSKIHKCFGFDSKHKPGEMSLIFERTLRIPDDGKHYDLPAELGCFPLRHIDDYADNVPLSWRKRGGVLMPMYQAEALWLFFQGQYPFAVKIAAGKINAITGEEWNPGLNRQPADYLVVPDQPWLDGFAVGKGLVRQFVAMPLGAGYSVEEQITGNADFGGIQIQIYPMKPAAYFRKSIRPSLPACLFDILADILPRPPVKDLEHNRGVKRSMLVSPPMGLGAGGLIKQDIYEDQNHREDWDLNETSRCFVHICNSLVWREITGTEPPYPPVTALEYSQNGLPWFDYYREDLAVVDGSEKLAGVKSVAAISKEKKDHAVIGHDTVKTVPLVDCGPDKRPDEVREWNESKNE